MATVNFLQPGLALMVAQKTLGFATRSESSNEIVSMTSYLRQTIVTIAFVNDFVQGGRVELYRLEHSIVVF